MEATKVIYTNRLNWLVTPICSATVVQHLHVSTGLKSVTVGSIVLMVVKMRKIAGSWNWLNATKTSFVVAMVNAYPNFWSNLMISSSIVSMRLINVKKRVPYYIPVLVLNLLSIVKTLRAVCIIRGKANIWPLLVRDNVRLCWWWPFFLLDLIRSRRTVGGHSSVPFTYPPFSKQNATNTATTIDASARCGQVVPRPLFLLPSRPFHFGHLQFGFDKAGINQSWHSSLPDYICVDDRFCDLSPRHNALIQPNNLACYNFTDLVFPSARLSFSVWFESFSARAARYIWRCNTFPDRFYHYCDRHHLYRCRNSSECISFYRLLDQVEDCMHGDDEDPQYVNAVVSLQNTSYFFKCSPSNTYIAKRLRGNGVCDCRSKDVGTCEDEVSQEQYVESHISFQTMCDGFTELAPVMVDGRPMTDETDCQQWLCDNIYTRCDGYLELLRRQWWDRLWRIVDLQLFIWSSNMCVLPRDKRAHLPSCQSNGWWSCRLPRRNRWTEKVSDWSVVR